MAVKPSVGGHYNTFISSFRGHPWQRKLILQFLDAPKFPSTSNSLGVNHLPSSLHILFMKMPVRPRQTELPALGLPPFWILGSFGAWDHHSNGSVHFLLSHWGPHIQPERQGQREPITILVDFFNLHAMRRGVFPFKNILLY
jgi:hypothetical protein